MRRLAERLSLASVVALLVATGASAQGAAPAPPWSLSLSAGETYDSNVTFSPVNGESAGEFGSQLQAGAARTWTLRRGSLGITGNIAENLYNQSTNLNALTYDVGASASYSITRRLSWSAVDTLSSGYAQDAKLLTDAGLLLPKVITRTNLATTSLSYALSPRSQIRWAVGETSIVFDSSQLASGARIFSSFSFSREVGAASGVGVSYQYDATTTEGGDSGTIEALLANWRTTFAKKYAWTASAGVRPYTLPGVSGFVISPALATGLSASLGRTQSVALTYDQSVEQAIGPSGTRETKGVSAAYSVSAGSRLNLGVNGNYVRSTYPQDPNRRLAARMGTASARYRLLKNLGLSAFVAYYLQDEGSVSPTSSYRASLAMAYRTSWR
jgi:hypothetical protein